MAEGHDSREREGRKGPGLIVRLNRRPSPGVLLHRDPAGPFAGGILLS